MAKMEMQHVEYLRDMIANNPRWADVAREELQQLRDELAKRGVFF